MLSIEEIKTQLEDMNVAAVARKVGVTRSWLNAIKTGKVKSCSSELQKRISDYMEARKQ